MDTISNLTKSAASAATPIIDHPYYPLGVQIAGYLANETSVPTLLGIFFGGCAVIFGATHVVVKRLQPSISTAELFTVMWFVLSGTIHLFFEGYYSVHHKTLASHQTLFGQLWKEYAFSDSRYLTNNAFVLCMESVTAFLWGPLCYICVAMIAYDHKFRHPMQIIVSLGQFYGDILYYATSMFDHFVLDQTYSRPEAWYFWGYYVLMNAFWIAIPGQLIYNSVIAIGEGMELSKKARAGKKRN